MTATKLSLQPDADLTQLVEFVGIQQSRPVRTNLDKMKTEGAPGNAAATTSAAEAAATAARILPVEASIIPLKNAAATSATNAASYEAPTTTSRNNTAASETAAGTSKNNAATYEAAALVSKGNASTQANSATNSAKTAFDNRMTAIASAVSGRSSVAVVNSAWSQDASAILAAALHRSPNTVTAVSIYDTTKDSDGGAWRNRVENASWVQEQLNGSWLGAIQNNNGFATEAEARCAGATVGANVLPNNDFSAGVGVWGLGTGMSITGGKLVITNAATATDAIESFSGALVGGQLYEVSVVVDSITQGSVRPQLEGSLGGVITRAGTYKFPVLAVGAGSRFILRTVASTTTAVISRFDVKPITALNTKSGDYFQMASNGLYYRMWKNLTSNTSFSGAVVGTLGSGGNIGTGWALSGQQSGVSVAVSGAGSENGMDYVELTFTGTPTASGYTNVQGPSFTSVSAGLSIAISSMYRLVSGANAATSILAAAGTSGGTWAAAGPATSTVNINGTDYTYQQRAATPTASGSFYPYFLCLNFATGVSLGAGAVFRIYQPQVEYSSTATTFEYKNSVDVSQTEVFRGNSAKFPRIAAIVAEQDRVVIYDLTQPGRPMWMVFKSTTYSLPLGDYWRGGRYANCVAAMQGILAIGTGGVNDRGLVLIHFIKDRISCQTNTSAYGYSGWWGGNIAQRHNGASPYDGTLPAIIGAAVNSVAFMVRPNAPVDTATGISVPVVAAAVGTTNAGQLGSVIMDDGTVVNYSQASNDGKSVAFTPRGDIAWTLSSGTGVYVMPLSTSNVANVAAVARGYGFTTYPNSGAGSSKKVVPAGSVIAAASPTNNSLALIRENPASYGSGCSALISAYYNTGYMIGDIRRVVMSDVLTGNVNGTGLLTGNDNNFASGTGSWVAAYQCTMAAVGGQLVVTATDVNPYAVRAISGLTAGQTYRLDVDYVACSNAGSIISVRLGDKVALADSTLGSLALSPGAGTKTVTFVANSSGILYIQLVGASMIAGDTFTVDNVQVTPVIADRSVKAKSVAINGTLTRTAVATAAQLVAYSGFSNDPIVELSTGVWYTPAGYDNVVSGASISGFTTNAGTQPQTRVAEGFTTVIGRKYTVSATSSLAGVTLYVRSGSDVGTIINQVTLASAGVSASVTFTATTTSTYLLFAANPPSSYVITGVSIKAVDAFGSSANVAQEAYSADIDPGVGPLTMSAWAAVNSGAFGPANFVPNSSAQGAVVGTPGSIPGWGAFFGLPSGITSQVVGTGTENGIPYADIRVSGTPATSVNAFLNMLGVQSCTATNGQQWTASVYVKLAAGSMANIALQYNVNGRDSAGNGVGGQGAAVSPTPTGATLDTQRVSTTITFSNSTVTYALAYFTFGFISAGVAVDLTLRIGCPQLNRGATAGLPIATTGTAYNGIAPIIDRSAASGSYYRMGLDGSGLLAAELYDGTTTRRATSIATYNTGIYNKIRAQYDTTGALTLKVNGVQVAQTTGSALLTLNNSNALFTLGNSRNLDSAFPGSIVTAKIGMTIPSDDVSLWAYGQEFEMFKSGAQVSLADTTSVLDIDYDESLDYVLVATATNRAAFNGLCRVSTVANTNGSLIKVNGASGIELNARSTTVPGVDVSIPTIAAKDKILNRATSAKVGGTSQVFSFDATTGQTDFVLPVGWNIVRVSANGTAKREGSTKDWTRVYDGFRETVRFNVAPGNAVWVRILARKS